METATSLELFMRTLTELQLSSFFKTACWFIFGLAVAMPPGWLLFRFRHSGMGSVGLGFLTAVFTILIAAILVGTHLCLSFGEAFVSGVSRDRPKAFLALTVAFPLVMMCTIFKHRKNQTEEERSN
jgi:hypothetical protein